MNLYYLQSAAAVVVTFGLVIFLHELGHFLMCRHLGVRVEKFAFGMGPELFGVTKGDTRYSVCAFPLGGFTKPAGEDLETCAGKPDEYFGQAWHRRLAIVFAGPAMNYLLAFGLFTGVVYWKGMPQYTDEPVIGNMLTTFPADRAGLKIGDRITAFNGAAITTWKQLSDAIHAVPNREVTLRYLRDGRESPLTLTTKADDMSGYGVIGILPGSVFAPVGFLAAVQEGASQCWNQTAFTVRVIASKIYRRQKPDLAGPVGIVQMVSRAAHAGWEDFIFFIGIISVAIGFFNLLPVPLLDGGHAVMYIWEGVSRRKPTVQLMNRVNSVGLVLLAMLLIFATYSDVVRLRGEHKAKAPAEVAP